MYQKILEIVEEEIDLENLKRTSNQINNYERNFSYKDFHKSASFCFNKFRESGISEVRKITLPSDGKTTYLDHIMPEAWDIEDAILKIVEPEVPEPILADHKKEALCVANRCAPTPKNGVIAGVISEEGMKNGADIKGKIVFIQHHHPKTIRREVIKRGGLGIISSYSEGYADLPDGTWWINGWGGGPGWYHTQEDKKIFCFSLPPRKGNYLAGLLREGRVRVKALVKSKIYDGSIDTITGLLRGQKDEEVLLLAHLYEPFLNDDAIGGAALIEISRLLSSLIKKGALAPLKRGMRFLISQERHGFVQFFQEKERRGGILAAINLDTISCDYRKVGFPINVRMNPASQPFFGDLLLQNMARFSLPPSYPYRIERGNFSDDTFIADKTIGIPVNWLWINPGKYHHNSLDAFDRITDWNLSKKIIALITTYTYFLAVASKKEISYLKNLLLIEAKINILEESGRLINDIFREKISQEEATARLNFTSSWQKERMLSLKKLNPKEETKGLEEEIEEITEGEKKKILSLPMQKEKAATEKKSGLTEKERIAENMIIGRRGVGFPFSLARVPYEQRVNKPEPEIADS
ncbi:MAG: M28 family peptidase, partial [Candidatus Omnitrophica bacterium]|nr:M28 family peptidase [Candidatus Omnitrophota bacterium]